jgi:hypothetical protein
LGVDLQKWHINNIGWKKKDALEIINKNVLAYQES